MKGKKLLAGLLSAAMVLGTAVMPALADNSEITFAEFLEQVTVNADNDIVFDGISSGENLKVKITPQSVCVVDGCTDCTGALNAQSESTPKRLDSKMAQYQIWSNVRNVKISNVDFVYEKAEFELHLWENRQGWDTNGKVNPDNGQIQILNSGDVEIKNCSFDGLDLNFWRSNGDGCSTTINNCTFKNTADGAGIKFICTEQATVTNNKFENCKAGFMFMPTSGCNAEATVTGNIFDGITEECIQLGGAADYSNATITVKSNIAQNAKENTRIFRIENDGAVISEFSNNTTGDIPMTLEGKTGFAAKINDAYYTTLEAAFAAANDGDEIILCNDAEITIHTQGYNPVKTTKASVINLNKHTMKVNDDNWYFDNKTIKNGTVKIVKEVINASGVFELHDGGDLTFEDVVIDATAVKSGYSIITRTGGSSNGKINFIGGEIKADSTGKLGIIVDDTQCSEINFTNTVMTVSNVNRNVIRGGKITISGNDATFTFNNVNTGFYLYDKSSLTINDKATVTITNVVGDDENNKEKAGIVLGADTPYTVADTATVNADVYRPATAATLANTVKISFADVTVNEGEKIYDLFLEADSEKTINRLTSAEFAFDFNAVPVTNGDMTYSVSGTEKINVSEVNGKYLFNFDGVTAPSATGTKIKIGQIKVEGYGKFSLAVENDSIVHATTIEDSLVTDFVTEPDADNEKQGKLNIEDSLTDVEIKEPTRSLTINIDFNNGVKSQKADYTDMAVTVSGPEFAETRALENITDNKAEVKFTDSLIKDRAYTVEVTGAGYRTARYTVTMTEDKTLNFWNNVKDNAAYVEEGKGTATQTTFLAGEIVKDGKINIYDLSAVVSYFGTINNVDEKSEYAKYDLNRDGKIDSKDVAYVLVSWGK